MDNRHTLVSSFTSSLIRPKHHQQSSEAKSVYDVKAAYPLVWKDSPPVVSNLQQEDIKTLEIVRNFFRTLQAFFEVSVIPKGISIEVSSMRTLLSTIHRQTAETKLIEIRLKQLNELSLEELNDQILENVKEIAASANYLHPYLPQIELRYSREISKIAYRGISQLSQINHLPADAQCIIISFMLFLSEIDESLKGKNQAELQQAASEYFENATAVIKIVKKLPAAIRTAKITCQTVKRARNLFFKSGSMRSEILRKLQRFVQETIKFYGVYAPLFSYDEIAEKTPACEDTKNMYCSRKNSKESLLYTYFNNHSNGRATLRPSSSSRDFPIQEIIRKKKKSPIGYTHKENKLRLR